MMRKGLLILFSGPSGVGKGTIMKEVMADERLKICFSVSMTTRAPRVGEVEGVNYFFVTRAEFEQAVAAGEMLEHAEFVTVLLEMTWLSTKNSTVPVILK